MRPTRRLASLTLVTLLGAATLLGGCSEVKDAASDKANQAACAVATKAVGGLKGQVDDAIDQIGADPAAARRKLAGLRDAVKGAESGISGDAKKQLTRAREALDKLVEEASDAAAGAEVDTSALKSSKQKFSDAVDGLANIC